jgi:glycosyltransferase involved in cell wall biosynthesis
MSVALPDELIADAPASVVPNAATAGGREPLRVCIVGEHASLAFGGEASLAYYYFKLLLRRGVDVSMVVHERTRDELHRDFPNDIHRITFVQDRPMHRLLWKIQSKLPRKLGEQTFGVALHVYNQWLTRRQVRRLINERGINVVHEAMPISPKATSMMFGLGVPVVIGPMCGGMDYPPAFQYLQGGMTRATEKIGRRVSHWVHKLIPGKLRADALVVASEATLRALPRGVRGRIFKVVESGADLDIWNAQPIERADSEVRFTFVGRLVDWKGVDLLLEAFKKVADVSAAAVLQIAGDGPLRQTLTARATELNIAQRVRFLGHISRSAGAQLVRESDVFVLPSLRECGGTVLLESMAVGVPMIATNWGGPAYYVNDACGIRVDPLSREDFIKGLASAMIRLASSPELRSAMGKSGQRRVRELYFDWQSKVDRMIEIYEQTIAAVSAVRA